MHTPRVNARTTRKPPLDMPCGYCFSNPATGYDHLVPWSYRPDNSDGNLYPSCKRCNGIAGNMIFGTLEAKREYVRSRLVERGEWGLQELPESSGTEKEVLQCPVQEGVLGQEESEVWAVVVQERKVREAVHAETCMAEVLLHKVQVGSMGEKAPPAKRSLICANPRCLIEFEPFRRIR